ncbi:MAG: GTP pyrophosphokinase family protein [Eubacterium sp.]|nr:GTP pyrophosphokinase family protein [Eubacterium sp.]
MTQKKEQIYDEKFLTDLFKNKNMEFFVEESMAIRELMTYYECAIMEVETKFNVLNKEFSLRHDRNPIETIKSRLKSVEGIIEKTNRKGIPFSSQNVEKYLTDIAGVRVICAFPKDIYAIRESFLAQDDIFLIEEKDYIQNPKPNGYRSLHLIVETPIFLHDSKKMMKVEVQFRTIAMDFWASLEHRIYYKKGKNDRELKSELKDCAEISANLDLKMQGIRERLDED